MDKAIKYQIIETIEYTYTTELRKKIVFMRYKRIDLVHYLMERYGKIIETDLKEN